MTKNIPKLKRIIQNIIILVLLSLSLVVLWFGGKNINNDKNKAMNQKVTNAYLPLPSEVAHRGVWDWNYIGKMTTQEMNQKILYLKAKKINSIYLDTSIYIEYEELPNSQIKSDKIYNLFNKLSTFTNGAKIEGISVYILAGNPDWGMSDKAYIQSKFVEFVDIFNKNNPNNQLAGLQFDIESYNLELFKTEKKNILNQYLSSIETTVKYYNELGSHFAIGYTIPYWFDNENGNIPEITYNGKSAPIAYHIFDTLNKIPNSYIFILDYRTEVDGTDGSVAHAQNEILYTSKYAKNVKVIIGQETTDVKPDKITFYNKSHQDLYTALQKITNSFKSYPSYQGYAVHDIDGLQNLN